VKLQRAFIPGIGGRKLCLLIAADLSNGYFPRTAVCSACLRRRGLLVRLSPGRDDEQPAWFEVVANRIVILCLDASSSMGSDLTYVCTQEGFLYLLGDGAYSLNNRRVSHS